MAAMSQATVDYSERARRRYGLELAPATVFASGGGGSGGAPRRFWPLLLLQVKPH
jgi:hypothetical protein